MVKLGYTNPPRDLVKRRMNRMDAAALKMEHATSVGLRHYLTRQLG